MSEPTKHNNQTELQSATYVHSGSGNMVVSGNFAPPPTFPINGSNLPHRYPDFVGRKDEINRVMDALASRAWIVTIDGPGGIGKTTLALEVAHLCKERAPEYPNIPLFTGYIWTSARGKADFSLNDVTREILHVLSDFENAKKQLDPTEQLSLAIRALTAKPCLLVIDNFETVKDEPLHRFLRDQIPPPSKVLITSRHHLQTGERVITIGGLDEDDAVRMLQLEAARLQIPLTPDDRTRLTIIAKKTFGVPLVLRWAMESVYNGKTLEWVVESLEHATADDIFNYIFKLSLSILDDQTRSIFRSMSLLATWARIEAIAALNSNTAAIQERVGQLVSLSLVEDNRKLVQSERRYQLQPFARYLASKELSELDDKGGGIVERALSHYLSSFKGEQLYSESLRTYLDEEFPNLRNIIRLASSLGESLLLKMCVELGSAVRAIDRAKGHELFTYLIDPIREASDEELILGLVDSIGDPYILGAPVDSIDFYGRHELLNSIQRNFDGNRVRSPVIALVGQRKIGKTSILIELHRRGSENSKYILIDLQAIPSDTGNAQVLYYFAQRIWRELTHGPDTNQLTLEKPDIETFKADPYRAFDGFLKGVTDADRRRFIIMLDEFEMLFHRRELAETEHLLHYFRSLVQTEKLNIITAGVSHLSELPVSLTVSPFFGVALSQPVSYFEAADAVELIQKPTYGLVKYDEETIGYLLRLSGGHPFVLQFLCSEVLRLCRERRTLLVSREIVRNVVFSVLDEGRYYFVDYLFKQVQDAFTQRLLIASAVLFDDSINGTFTLEQIKTSLGLEASDSQIKAALTTLVRREILSLKEDGNIAFTMEIVAHWLLRKFPTVQDLP